MTPTWLDQNEYPFHTQALLLAGGFDELRR